MRSSGGQHWIALDHVRALAAFLVFSWHFLHATAGTPVPFASAPVIFPLALIDEGQTGVALFMTLSGYLFGKLLDGREVDYIAFLWNRALRLLPLMLVVIAVMAIGAYREDGLAGLQACLAGVYLGLFNPFLPLDHGLWSIVIEAHFYFLLPLLLAMQRRFGPATLALVAGALTLRFALAANGFNIHFFSYWTILGRIDQFALGLAAFRYRHLIAGRTPVAAVIALAFCSFYWWFDRSGGTYFGPPSDSPLWAVMPAIEGGTYAALIAWYDSRPVGIVGRLSAGIAKIGTWSFSIYLLHFFVVFSAPVWIAAHIMSPSNFYVATLWSALCFAAILPMGYLSYRFVERPFLRNRRRYLRDPQPSPPPGFGAYPVQA
ncbi:acyltransferase [Sphingomonas sp. BIUV-7]|uniref:Acyltransferase n=1 Tax=Sphingomonas natans TaxID=3063330 RepID=A0ABT8Y4G8_9SPHN|nr:acyltransferase [Sphingomonas sp. BIUV-7]MDO6412887.1 acyltransferase [Sphingomonas sp. BIUV-7]